MPTQQGQTDEILKVTLTSRILGAHWADDGASAGGKAAYEVKTQYVGDGAPIKITFKDLEGKTLSTLEGTVLSNLHRGLFTASAANATGGVTFEAELPKHGLKVAGGRLKMGKPIEFPAMRFTDPEGKKALTELLEGKPAACEAKVKGLKDGDKVLVSVHLRTDSVMQDGHLFVEGEVPVKDGKVVLLFTPKVKTRLDAIRIQAELDKEGGTYFQPEYVFACRAGGMRAVSEPAKAVQELTINFWEFPGQAGSLEGKQVTITGPDGKKETRTIPKNGTIVIPKGKPGRVSVKGEIGSPLKVSDATKTPPKQDPPWLAIAKKEIGVKEVVGKKHEARVLQYHDSTDGKAKDDETPWCSSFVNWVMQQSGYTGTRSAWAKSWATWKEARKLPEPAYGCIGVIDWSKGTPPGKGGHVGFVVGKKGKSILMLGGNQGNRVKIASYAPGPFIAFMMPKDFSPIDYDIEEKKGKYKNDDYASTR